MFSRKLADIRGTLAFRLTVWYGGIFAVSSTLAFVLVYVFMSLLVHERIDEDLRDDLEEFESFMETGGIDRVGEEIALETQGKASEDTFFRAWSTDGNPLVASDLTAWAELVEFGDRLAPLGDDGAARFTTLELADRDYKVRTITGPIGDGVILEIGESIEEHEEFLEALLNGFLALLAFVIIAGGPIGWFMARRALRGVEDVTRTATRIADGALDQRVTASVRGDELDRLAQAFNTMLDRIQALILGMREMTDNLAHDLRSPVARIRASAEMALAGGGSEAEWEAMANDTTEECDRLLEMINTTLDIAESESGAARLKIADVDLVGLVNDACDLFQTVAEDKHIELTIDLPARCVVKCDRQRLQRVVANLLDNALKYTEPGGRVKISLGEEKLKAKLTIEDSGVGISADELPRIFQRFYRCDWSRSEYGNGLGLSLALAFVRAHHGDISVRSTPGKGSTFTVMLPFVSHGIG